MHDSVRRSVLDRIDPHAILAALTALTSACFGYVLFAPDEFARHPQVVSLARYVAAGGLSGIGITLHAIQGLRKREARERAQDMAKHVTAALAAREREWEAIQQKPKKRRAKEPARG